MGKFSAYKLPLKTLAPGKHAYAYHLDKQFFENMDSTDIRDANVDVTLEVNFANDVYALNFAVTGTVTVPCDRCLDDLPIDIDTTYKIKVKYGDGYRDDSDELMEIPHSDADLNVAYMIFDTVSLAIPIKHVHPLGKCNRAMSSLLKKHRATDASDPDAELEDQLIDEMDSMPDAQPTDPRWNALKDIQTDTES